MKASTVAALLGCAAIAPASAFTGGASLAAAGALRQRDARRRGGTSSVQMMAIDPATVHSVGDYVNAIGSTGLDQAWLSHVMHGELLVEPCLLGAMRPSPRPGCAPVLYHSPSLRLERHYPGETDGRSICAVVGD